MLNKIKNLLFKKWKKPSYGVSEYLINGYNLIF